MKTISIVAPEPMPAVGVESVHDRLRHEYGDVYPEVLDDLWAKALQSQEKYKLDRPGLYTFNGRNALKDAYQEVIDLIAYLKQSEMEGYDDPHSGYIANQIPLTLQLAQRMRDHLEEWGVIE